MGFWERRRKEEYMKKKGGKEGIRKGKEELEKETSG